MKTLPLAIDRSAGAFRRTAFLTVMIASAVFTPRTGRAQSMVEALSRAYANSPKLDAAARELAAVRERLSQASAGYLPQLDFSGAVGASNEFTDTQDERFSANADASLSLTQPIYRGGGTTAAIDQADYEISAQEATFRGEEQSVLLESATTYLDVWRDRQVTKLIADTLLLLATELQSVSRQKELGAATATDVAQTEVRIGQIESDQIDAEATLTGSQAQFERLTGMKPDVLDDPVLDLAIPATTDEAVALALSENPDFTAAMFQKLAAQRATNGISAEYRPSLDLRSTLQYFSADIQENGGEVDDDVAIARVELRLTMPLYRGASSSLVRESEEVAHSLQRIEEDTRRRLTVDTRGAWNRMMAAKERIERLETAVEAARRVISGTEREYQLGKRTTLDLLNARRDLLDLQTTLVSVRRDHEVAKFDVAVAIGRFTTGSFGLDIAANDVAPLRRTTR